MPGNSKQAVRIPKENEQFYRDIVACSPDVILVHVNGIIKFTNPAAVKFFYAADQKELINKPIWIIIPKEFHQLVKERIQHAFYGKDGLTPVIEMQLIRLNGELVDVDVTGCAISYRGKPAIQVIIRDISARKRAEDMLKENQARLQASIDNLPFEFWVRDKRGVCVMENSVCSQRYGSQLGKMVKNSGIASGLAASWRENNRRAMAGEIVKVEQECKIGKEKYYYQVIVAPFLVDGQIRGIIGCNIDITEHKRAQEILNRDKETFKKMVRERSGQLIEALLELEKSRHLSTIGTLAATVAHELRNPLAAISIAAFNIKNKTGEPALIGPHLHTIESKISESDQIINNLLLYSRIKPPCLEKIYVCDIVTECLKVSQAKCKKKISVKRECGKVKCAVIKADPLQIREVINNILNNACEALPDKGGKLLINASDEGKFIKIYFKDNGAGIPKENLDKIFDPFFTTKSYGTGLGLAVSRQILNLHNGTINIESKLKKGTTVTVTLPKK